MRPDPTPAMPAGAPRDPARHDLTDQQWGAARPLLYGGRTPPGPAADDRLFLSAVLWVAKTGVPWRALSARYGNWNSVWRRSDWWSEVRRWAVLSAALGEPDLSAVHLDGTSVPGPPAGVRLPPPPGRRKKTPAPAGVSAGAGAG